MPETLTIDLFQPHEGETFFAETGIDGAPPLPLQLASVTPLNPKTGAGQRQPFSLLFIQPQHVNVPQRIYPMHHPALGDFEIFIVPVGPDARGMQYEAIFT